MSETDTPGPELALGARDRLTLTSQTTQITDFDGDVMLTTRAWGDQLRSVDARRLFFLAVTLAAGLTAGALGAASFLAMASKLMGRIFGG